MMTLTFRSCRRRCGEINMNRKSRLSTTIKSNFTKRRLDLVTEKNELIMDIETMAGSEDLDTLEEEICAFGDSLHDTLPNLSIPTLRRIHARIVTGHLPIPETTVEF
jgi:hypothetical protein